MAGSDSRKASGTPRPAKVTEKEIPATANEAAVEPLRLGDTVVFDPAKRYFAIMKTTKGTVGIRLLHREQPVVQADFYVHCVWHAYPMDRAFDLSARGESACF